MIHLTTYTCERYFLRMFANVLVQVASSVLLLEQVIEWNKRWEEWLDNDGNVEFFPHSFSAPQLVSFDCSVYRVLVFFINKKSYNSPSPSSHCFSLRFMFLYVLTRYSSYLIFLIGIFFITSPSPHLRAFFSFVKPKSFFIVFKKQLSIPSKMLQKSPSQAQPKTRKIYETQTFSSSL